MFISKPLTLTLQEKLSFEESVRVSVCGGVGVQVKVKAVKQSYLSSYNENIPRSVLHRACEQRFASQGSSASV